MRALALRTVSLLALATLGSISATPAARAEDVTDDQFGKVHFQTSCNEVAQRRFDRGMRYQHSFWYRPAQEVFGEALKADPDCAIAHWGIALGLLGNPLDAQARDTRIQTWPCKSGGICGWQN